MVAPIKTDGCFLGLIMKIRFKVDSITFHQGFTKQTITLIPKEKVPTEQLPFIDLKGKLELEITSLEGQAEYFDLGREFYIEFHRIQ